MLQLNQLTLSLGDDRQEIFNELNLTFETGRLYGITGPNGGGKTSIAKTIAGIYQASAGKILLDGEDLTPLSVTERARRGIRYAFQNPPRFKGIDIGWFLRMAGPASEDREIRAVMRRIGLCPNDYLQRMVDASLSGGEMKRLEIASVLLGEAKVAILDEPEAGLDLWGFERMLQLVHKSHTDAAARVTILISHSERFLEIADEIVIIADGRVKEKGPLQEIRPSIEEGIHCRWRKACLEEEAEDESKCGR